MAEKVKGRREMKREESKSGLNSPEWAVYQQAREVHEQAWAAHVEARATYLHAEEAYLHAWAAYLQAKEALDKPSAR